VKIRLLLIFSLITASLSSELYAVEIYEKFKSQWPDTDFSKSSIDYSRVIDGGPPKDGIPSIDNPSFTVTDVNNIHPDEPVIAVNINGEARAYPLRILLWHEIVNDKIGNTPIAVTYCPLCNASVVFERVINGDEVEFGVTGKLYNSDMLMYDRKTESWWQQYTGEAVVGEMLGKKLNKITSRVESIKVFKQRHPKGKVLIPNDIIRSYGATPYTFYDTQTFPFLYDGEYNGKLKPMEYVVVVGNQAWPLKLLQKETRIRSGNIIILWTEGQKSVLDNYNISNARDIGNVVVIKEVEEGVFVDTLYSVVFAFVFDAFHPNGIINYNVEKVKKD
jgi:hypothetical protein